MTNRCRESRLRSWGDSRFNVRSVRIRVAVTKMKGSVGVVMFPAQDKNIRAEELGRDACAFSHLSIVTEMVSNTEVKQTLVEAQTN